MLKTAAVLAVEQIMFLLWFSADALYHIFVQSVK